jgi:RNA polymerase sigma factor (sigma-70 family)
MAANRIARLVRFCRRALSPQQADESTDAHLLELFIQQKDETAFEELVRRHGPMVLGVCLRVLGNLHDAEDAFQAVFLVLARKPASIRPRAMIGNWLHGVAFRTALEARKNAARRQSKERHYGEILLANAREEMDDELLAFLDQELTRLPDRYRAVLVLCDLEGKTRKEAAQQLGCKEGTIASRLDRARNLLARRLARRGLLLTGAALAAALSTQAAPAAVPAALLASAAGIGTSGGLLSGKVIALAEKVLRALLWRRLKIAMGLIVVLLLLTAVGLAPLLGRHPRPLEEEEQVANFHYESAEAPPAWGTPLDPNGDCTITIEGGALTIDMPATPHDLSAEIRRLGAPRVLQMVEGDFTVQVKVCAALRPTPPGTVPGRLPYQAGGLLVWSNRNQYIRLERAAIQRDGAAQSGVAFELREKGQLGAAHWVAFGEQDAHLRLQRRGQQFLGSVSADGQQWTALPSLTLPLPAKVRVGVAAVNTAQQPLAVRFENLRLER